VRERERERERVRFSMHCLHNKLLIFHSPGHETFSNILKKPQG
jgi:hypothetical protein